MHLRGVIAPRQPCEKIKEGPFCTILPSWQVKQNYKSVSLGLLEHRDLLAKCGQLKQILFIVVFLVIVVVIFVVIAHCSGTFTSSRTSAPAFAAAAAGLAAAATGRSTFAAAAAGRSTFATAAAGRWWRHIWLRCLGCGWRRGSWILASSHQLPDVFLF